MKKIITLLFSLLAFVFVCFAQTTFSSENIISNTAGFVTNVYAFDMDNDGDYDVVSSSLNDKIIWYEIFPDVVEHLVAEFTNDPFGMYVSDLDGDSDNDIIFAKSSSDFIAWNFNTDGLGNFGSENLFPSLIEMPAGLFACDIDGDNDNDIVITSYVDDKVSWLENSDGSGTFLTETIITTEADGAFSVYACDIDGDGDNDIISASREDDKIAWYENTDGEGTFGTQQVISLTANYAYSVYASDLDGDGDLDVLSASNYDDKIAWYENTDGNGTFSSENVIEIFAYGATDVFACDLDLDGDNDILSSSEFDNTLAWYENIDGMGSFGSKQIISSSSQGASSVFAADLDGDDDNDVVLGSNSNGKIVWFENLTPVNLESPRRMDLLIYPNPTKDIIQINFKDSNDEQVMLTDITGKVLLQEFHLPQNHAIDLSKFKSGLYIVHIQSSNEISSIKIIKE